MKHRLKTPRRDQASALPTGAFELSRRGVLKGSLFGAAAMGLGRTATAAPAPHVEFDPAMFLMDRTTFGWNQEMVNAIRSMGYSGYLEWQLAADQIDDSAADQILDGFEFPVPIWFEGDPADNPNKFSSIFGKTPAEIFFTFPGPTPGTTGIGLSFMAVLMRAIYSRRQLFYVMCDFWTNVQNRSLLQLYQHSLWWPFQENVIQAHALGKYRDMVRAAAIHSSMLLYLDQYKSTKVNPNENYARELMELHTVGTVHSEQDVAQAAKVLTGYGMHFFEAIIEGYPLPDQYDCPNVSLDYWGLGEFVFEKENHTLGTKTVLGQQYGDFSMCFPEPCAPCDGLEEGEQLIDDLTLSDAGSEHIARRLIAWLITDDPAPNLVTRVADAYKTSGSDIKETLRALFDPNYADEIHASAFEKVRRPLNFVVGAIRTLTPEHEPICDADGDGTSSPEECELPNAVVTGIGTGTWPTDLYNAGQIPGARLSPDGYPAANEAWTGAMFPRVEFASDLAHNVDTGLIFTTAKLNSLFGDTPNNELAQKAAKSLYRSLIRPQEINEIQAYLDGLAATPAPNTPSDETLRREAVSMILSSPTYQYLH